MADEVITLFQVQVAGGGECGGGLDYEQLERRAEPELQENGALTSAASAFSGSLPALDCGYQKKQKRMPAQRAEAGERSFFVPGGPWVGGGRFHSETPT